jgi:hypothetical protein
VSEGKSSCFKEWMVLGKCVHFNNSGVLGLFIWLDRIGIGFIFLLGFRFVFSLWNCKWIMFIWCLVIFLCFEAFYGWKGFVDDWDIDVRCLDGWKGTRFCLIVGFVLYSILYSYLFLLSQPFPTPLSFSLPIHSIRVAVYCSILIFWRLSWIDYSDPACFIGVDG